MIMAHIEANYEDIVEDYLEDKYEDFYDYAMQWSIDSINGQDHINDMWNDIRRGV
jgi:hypothetical protein